MKRLLYIFAFLFVSFAAMAYDLAAGYYVYFANTNAWTSETKQFLIGHGSWSTGYKMTPISNTNLFYWQSVKWDGYTQWAVIGTSGSDAWGDEGNSVSNRKGYAEKATALGSNKELKKYSLIYPSNDNESVFLSTNTSNYSTLLNKTHTIKTYVDDVESSDGGTISATSYKLSSATGTQFISGTTSIEAAYTATITLTAIVNPGYEFMGWYVGSTELSTETTYSYTAPNAAKTISAKFRKLAVAEPRIVSFSASATEIDLGQSVTFGVEVENAELNNVVFKCGEDIISNPWTPEAGGKYTITANLEGATPKSVVVTVYAATVFFDNTNSEWAEIYAYCWDEGGSSNKAWPGVKLINPDGNTYTYKSTKVYQKIIFNAGNGQPQTEDLVFENGKTYSISKPIPFIVGTKELCGSDWNESDSTNMMQEVDGIFTKTYVNVPIGIYEFKVVYNGNWLGFSEIDTKNSTAGVKDSGGNILFKMPQVANVVISYNSTTNKISIVADGVDKFVDELSFPVGSKFYYSPKKEGARYAAYLFGTSGDNWVDIDKEYNDVYSFIMPEGEWDGLIYCEMESGTIENNWDNKKVQTADLRYDGVNNWYVEGENSNYWRKFENLIFAGQKLYFKPDSNWEADGARFAAYYWDIAKKNAWIDCAYNEESDVYEVVAPIVGEGTSQSVWVNIKFVRMNPATEENNFNDGVYWNKTDNLTFDGTNDLFIIKLTEKDGEKGWDSADINNWINYGICFQDVIFLKPNEDQKNNRFSVYLWNGFNDNCWVKFKPLTGYTDVYYVVVPEGFWTGANICSMNPNTDNDSWDKEGDVYIDLLNQTDNLTYHSDKLLYQTPDTWNFKGPADECWSDLEEEIDFDPENAIEINGGMENGAYYQAKKYTMSISGSDVNKWHWISLPYDVNVADIKSSITTENPYGIDFIMKRYDTATRAAWEGEQAPVDDQTWVQLTKDDVLEAGRGYILGVNNSLTEGVTLTFPANSYFHIVSNQVDGKNDNVEAIAPELNVNSNWHLIGTGLYAEAQSSGGVNFVAYPDESGSDYTYYYLGSVVEHEYFEPTQIAVSMLEKYKAFFVQYGGEYSFSKEAVVRNMAPRRARTEEDVEQYYINIKGEKERSRTAIFLADDGSNDYVVGKDFLHFGVTGKTTQLYTKQNARLLSFNYLKKEDCVVELGGYVINAGEYTISLTDNGASSIVLIDNYTGESVDLTFEDYTFTTEKGSLDGRFTLAISYIEKDVTTEIGTENVGNILVSNYNDLVVIDGLNIGNHVWIYDAVGRCVSSFVADNERHVLNLKEGAYVLKTSMESVKFVVW